MESNQNLPPVTIHIAEVEAAQAPPYITDVYFERPIDGEWIGELMAEQEANLEFSASSDGLRLTLGSMSTRQETMAHAQETISSFLGRTVELITD